MQEVDCVLVHEELHTSELEASYHQVASVLPLALARVLAFLCEIKKKKK